MLAQHLVSAKPLHSKQSPPVEVAKLILQKRKLTARKMRDTRITRERNNTKRKVQPKQNFTVSLDRDTIQKAKIVAARRSTSISGLVASQIEILVGEEEAYERAERQALRLLDQGFHLGGVIRASRDELHER